MSVPSRKGRAIPLRPPRPLPPLPLPPPISPAVRQEPLLFHVMPRHDIHVVLVGALLGEAGHEKKVIEHVQRRRYLLSAFIGVGSRDNFLDLSQRLRSFVRRGRSLSCRIFLVTKAIETT